MDRMTETQDEFFRFLPKSFSLSCQDFHKKEAQKIFRNLSQTNKKNEFATDPFVQIN